MKELKSIIASITFSEVDIETIENEYDQRNKHFDAELYSLLNELREEEDDIKAWQRVIMRNAYIANRVIIEQSNQINKLLLATEDIQNLDTTLIEQKEALKTKIILAKAKDIISLNELSLLSGYSQSSLRQFMSRTNSNRLEQINEAGSNKKLRFKREYAIGWINSQSN